MKALLYVTKRTFINKLKKALQKPVSLLLIIALILYAIFIIVTMGSLISKVHFDSIKGLVVIITMWTLLTFLMNFAGYSSRRGVLFRPSHTHFIFPAPISPKLILLHGAWMNYVLSVCVYLLFVIGGITVFGVEPWKVFLLFLVGCGMEILLETSVMVLLYTSDRFSIKAMKSIGKAIMVFLIAVVIFIVLYFRKYGLTLESASVFVDWKGLQMIPVVGWNIAVYRMIFLGPDTLNVICSVLYFLSVALIFFAAWRMKCTGGYYEDAAKFADDYAEMKKKKANGEMVMGIGSKKKKFRRVHESIKATGAKAIFHRQLLEYKKEKYFIFSKLTLLFLVIAVVASKMMYDSVMKSGMAQAVMAGIILYATLVISSYVGKWEEELKSPYLYLIPDSPIKKLWYATLMEHFKALIDGCVFCIPFGVVWGIEPVQVVLAIITFTVLQANKIYTMILVQCILGDSLGKKGQNLVRTVIQMFILGTGGAVLGVVAAFINVDLVFPIVLIYSMIITVIIGLVASIRFYSMEQVE